MEQLEVQRVLAKEGVLSEDVLEPPSPNPVAPSGETHTEGGDEQREEP